MWTCGIDIATQQATPAMQSSVCAAPVDRPNGRASRIDRWAPPASATAASAGGRPRMKIASVAIDSAENTPRPM